MMRLQLLLLLLLLPHHAAIRRTPYDLLNQQEHRQLKRDSGRRTPVDVPLPTSPDDHLVTTLPLLAEFPTQHWAGLLPASSKNDKYLFYWLFAPAGVTTQQQQQNLPLLIWLNGGALRPERDQESRTAASKRRIETLE